MTYVVLLVLAILWAIVLVPPLLRNRDHRGSRADSIGRFSRQMSLLDRTTGEVPAVVVPLGRSAPPDRSVHPSAGGPVRTMAEQRTAAMGPTVDAFAITNSGEARKRRRDVLVALAGLALLTLVAAVAVGGIFVPLNLLADALLLGFVVLLVRHQRRIDDARHKIRPIRPPATVRSYRSAGDVRSMSGS